MTRYFVCSVGEPNKEYDSENLNRCVINKGYYLNVGCVHQGSIQVIQPGDLLILKYQDELIAYGRAIDSLQEKNEANNINNGWIFVVSVNYWITGNSVSNYGIQNAQMSGSPYDAVKEVSQEFALKKIEEIGFPF
jgi:hypothetical protein